MNDERWEKYKCEYEGYSQDQLREELFRLTMECPDSQIEERKGIPSPLSLTKGQ